MATTLGWLLGSLIFPGLALINSGFGVGLFQWFVLQSRIRRPWRWVVATFIGWTLGYFITLFVLPPELAPLKGMVIGLMTGIAQWLILRQELHWAGWWIVFSTIGWITGLTLLPGILLTGTMAGALTGLCLEVLIQYPKPKTMVANPS